MTYGRRDRITPLLLLIANAAESTASEVDRYPACGLRLGGESKAGGRLSRTRSSLDRPPSSARCPCLYATHWGRRRDDMNQGTPALIMASARAIPLEPFRVYLEGNNGRQEDSHRDFEGGPREDCHRGVHAHGRRLVTRPPTSGRLSTITFVGTHRGRLGLQSVAFTPAPHRTSSSPPAGVGMVGTSSWPHGRASGRVRPERLHPLASLEGRPSCGTTLPYARSWLALMGSRVPQGLPLAALVAAATLALETPRRPHGPRDGEFYKAPSSGRAPVGVFLHTRPCVLGCWHENPDGIHLPRRPMRASTATSPISVRRAPPGRARIVPRACRAARTACVLLATWAPVPCVPVRMFVVTTPSADQTAG